MKRLLIRNFIGGTFPDCRTTYFTTFTDKEVPRAHGIACLLIGKDIHRRKVFDVDTTPLNIGVPKVGAQVVAGDTFLVKHLAQVNFISVIQGTKRPMLGNCLEPRVIDHNQPATPTHPARDCITNHTQAVLIQALQEVFLLCNQRINPRCLVVKELAMRSCSSFAGKASLAVPRTVPLRFARPLVEFDRYANCSLHSSLFIQ